MPANLAKDRIRAPEMPRRYVNVDLSCAAIATVL